MHTSTKTKKQLIGKWEDREVTVYVADDGTEFESEEKALQHERREEAKVALSLEKQAHHFSKGSGKPSIHGDTYFLATSQEDYQRIKAVYERAYSWYWGGEFPDALEEAFPCLVRFSYDPNNSKYNEVEYLPLKPVMDLLV